MKRICLRITAVATAVTCGLLAGPLNAQESAWATKSLSSTKTKWAPAGRAKTPKVTPLLNGYFKARIEDDPTAVLDFHFNGDALTVNVIKRGQQPRGSSGQLIAEAIMEAKMKKPSVVNEQPKYITMDWIDNSETVRALAAGEHPRNTFLGKTIKNLVTELEGYIDPDTGWLPPSKTPNGKDRITAIVTYS